MASFSEIILQLNNRTQLRSPPASVLFSYVLCLIVAFIVLSHQEFSMLFFIFLLVVLPICHLIESFSADIVTNFVPDVLMVT